MGYPPISKFVAPPSRGRAKLTRPEGGTPSIRRGFTLAELLVVVVIIALLATMSLGAVSKAREAGRIARTKATIAKLNDVLNRLYAKYRTRRVMLNFSGLNPNVAAQLHLAAIRDLMRMELPDCWKEIQSGPTTFTIQGGQTYALPAPAAWINYNSRYAGMTPNDHEQAKCLYMIVANAGADAKSQFTADEIHMNVKNDPNGDGDNLPCFVDGWGNPIGFLRWAPGCSQWSDVQIPDAFQHHDPLDPRSVQSTAYQLYPFIYAGVVGKTSAGTDDYGIVTYGIGGPGTPPTTPTVPLSPSYCSPMPDPYWTGTAAASTPGYVTSGNPYTNHHMEQK